MLVVPAWMRWQMALADLGVQATAVRRGREATLTFWVRGPKPPVRYPVWLEGKENPSRMVLRSVSRDVRREPGITYCISWLAKMWRLDHPLCRCRFRFQRDRFHIWNTTSFDPEALRPDLCKVFQAAAKELRAAMNWMFPVVAKNVTMIHRSASNWPDVKRLDIP